MTPEAQEKRDRLIRGLDKMWDMTRPVIRSGPVDKEVNMVDGEPIEETPDDESYQALWAAYQDLKRNKPNDRSGKDKHYAVTLTQLREAIGYFHHWVIVQEGDE